MSVLLGNQQAEVNTRSSKEGRKGEPREMATKNLTLTLGQFLLLGETQAKILAMQGYQISVIGDNANNFHYVEKSVKADKSASATPAAKSSKGKKHSTKGAKKPTTKLSPKDYKATFALYLLNKGKINEKKYKECISSDNLLSELYHKFKSAVKFNNSDAVKLLKDDKSSSKSKSTKGGKAKKDSTKGAKKPTKSKLGEVKVGDYFKVVNTTNGKTTGFGVAEKVNVTKNELTDKSGKLWVLANCKVITKATFGKLQAKLDKKKKANSTKLSAADFKQVYAAILRRENKITDQDLAKAKSVPEFARELYTQFKNEVKVSNDDALKFLAENSAKAQA